MNIRQGKTLRLKLSALGPCGLSPRAVWELEASSVDSHGFHDCELEIGVFALEKVASLSSTLSDIQA